MPGYLALTRIALVLAGITCVAGMTACVPGRQSAPVPKAPFIVYLAPSWRGGSDEHDGLSPSSAILTLARAEQVLEQYKPSADVQVRIEQGTYTAPTTIWTFYVPSHTISFMPIGYALGQGRPAAGDPIFTSQRNEHAGTYAPGWWFQAQLPIAPSDPLHDGGTTGLRFYYLRVEGYSNGISLDGKTGHAYHDNQHPPMYIKPSAGLNGNRIFGMTLTDIGDEFAPGMTGYGAILLTDSSGNRIINNTFDHVENAGGTTGLIHGIYITHFSSFNIITANKLTTISSYAIKVRDRSDFNDVEYNRFNATGGSSAYRDEFCDLECYNTGENSPPLQCASYGNRFFHNMIGTVFGGTAKQASWSLSPPGLTNAGGSGCFIPAGRQRLRTGSNT